ncbi:MAG: lysine 2,3-aminomutase [Myxococcales bacterium]|nr:lysine 2,3-aminomutase [Myxococcales bacterium]
MPQLARFDQRERFAMGIVARVFPFRVNRYVVEELIDWSKAPDDPMFRLLFPQREMLSDAHFERLSLAVRAGASEEVITAIAREIQLEHNPHPAGQKTLNVPLMRDGELAGVQHKYRETVLFFPTQGQTCHSYCAYCFRWPQFVGLDDMKFASAEVDSLVGYLRSHPDVTNVLFTGGDPLVMRTKVLERYLTPLVGATLPHLSTIRIGTKSTAFWPQRFVSDEDADDLLRLFESIVAKGFHLAVMAHSSHPVELETPIAQRAIARIRATGAVVRCQAPLVRHVNDSALAWAEMWRLQAQLGAIPYYMFVERNTGPRRYFDTPLAAAYEIYRDAIARVSGLARTARGPSMSATPGKIAIDGTPTIHGEKVFALRLLQAREPSWVGRPFYAKFDASATWFDELSPAFGEARFFFDTASAVAPWERPPLERRHLPVHPSEAA